MRTEFKKLNNKGITLIALVITIIVLLILAGVSIAMLTGENGILTQEQNAKKETERAKIIEEVRLDILGKQTENGSGDISADELEEILKKYFSNEEQNLKDIIAGTSTDKLISKEDETIKIDLSEIYNGDITDGTTPPPATGATDGSWSDEKKVNTPVIKENMELVKWDETQNKFVPDDTNSSYNYDETTREWANAVVRTKDENNEDIESYFVWIPRYEYKIENGTIDIKFIKTSQTTPTSGYTIHPAFINDSSNNYENGGWNEELPGIWVGKYESSRSDSEGATQGTSTTIKIQPGVTSWRSTTIGDMYNYAKAYSPTLNSHMLKNSEWGAVAYLTESKYGRNGTEVTINNSSNFITGSAGNSVSANEDVGTTSEYWSPQGVLASSTGNVYGIYDLSGGAWEYVAAYYSGSTSSNLTNNGSSLVGETDKKMVTAYTGTGESSAYKPGDATYETSGWHGDNARGGVYNDGADAGVFNFSRNGGSASGYSFRMCLAVK